MTDRTAIVNQSLAAVLKGAYVTEGFTLPSLGEATGMPWRTLQRVMAGLAPVTMGQLELIASAIGRDPQELFEAALAKADRDEMSQGPRIPVSLDTEREKREAAMMSGGALEGAVKRAAKKANPELGTDEPQAP